MSKEFWAMLGTVAVVTITGTFAFINWAASKEYVDKDVGQCEARLQLIIDHNDQEHDDQEEQLETAIAGLALQVQQGAVQSRIDWLDAWIGDALKMYPPNPLHNRNATQQVKEDYRRYVRELEDLRIKMQHINQKLLE